MPLVDVADYVDGYTELKALCGYGLHKSDHMGTSGGMGSLAALGCGGDCACAKCRGVSGLGDVDFSGIGADEYKLSDADLNQLAQNYPQQFMQQTKVPVATPGAASAGTPTKVQQYTDAVVGGFQKLGTTLAPLFQKAPREKVVVHKDPDYTTYAVIGGAVIVASVLAIAVGKSGRKG